MDRQPPEQPRTAVYWRLSGALAVLTEWAEGEEGEGCHWCLFSEGHEGGCPVGEARAILEAEAAAPDPVASPPDHDCLMPSACGVTGFYCSNATQPPVASPAPLDARVTLLEAVVREAAAHVYGLLHWDTARYGARAWLNELPARTGLSGLRRSAGLEGQTEEGTP